MTLDELIKTVLDIKLQEANPDDDMAMLHMADCKYDNNGKPLDKPGLVLVALAVGPGSVMSPLARLMVATSEPACAVLSLPSFTAKLREGQNLATFGVNRVSELPADMVQDSLVIYGEDASGVSQMHMYVIERDNEGKRIWVKQPHYDVVSSHFRPLFVLPKMLKEVLPLADEFDLDNEQAYFHAKRAIVRILADNMESALTKYKSTA